MMIPGGTFSVDELQQILEVEDRDEFIDALKKRVKMVPLLNTLEDIRRMSALHEIEVALTPCQPRPDGADIKRYPFSVLPVIVYLEGEEAEVANLRALARGKEAGIPR